MRKTGNQRAIMFADVGGSSAFYNLLGDAEAKILQNNKTIYHVMHNAGVMVVVAD